MIITNISQSSLENEQKDGKRYYGDLVRRKESQFMVQWFDLLSTFLTIQESTPSICPTLSLSHHLYPIYTLLLVIIFKQHSRFTSWCLFRDWRRRRRMKIDHIINHIQIK